MPTVNIMAPLSVRVLRGTEIIYTYNSYIIIYEGDLLECLEDQGPVIPTMAVYQQRVLESQ